MASRGPQAVSATTVPGCVVVAAIGAVLYLVAQCNGSPKYAAYESDLTAARAARPSATWYARTAARLRADSTPSGAVLATIGAGDAVDVVGCGYRHGAVCAVDYGGRSGFVAKKLLRSSAPPVPSRALSGSGSGGSGSSGGGGYSSGSSGYTRGSRGGCYTYSKSGRKRYVSRSKC